MQQFTLGQVILSDQFSRNRDSLKPLNFPLSTRKQLKQNSNNIQITNNKTTMSHLL